MPRDCILAVDQGTTNTKGLLFDRSGKAVFRAASSVSLIQPKPGYVEQDPVELWQSTRKVLQDCAARAAAEGMKIAGISISNQRETGVAWRSMKGTGGAGSPVCNAISWQCRRSESVCEKVRSSARLIQDRTGLPLDPLLTATKWMWLFDEHPSLRTEAASGEVLLGTVDSWLLYNLTDGQEHVTDLTNASRTALLNLENLGWDEELLALFNIPREALPSLSPSSGVLGECRAIPELTGVPIVAMIGDSHAALVGHGCYEPGTVKATYGTGSSLMMLTPELIKAQNSLARTIAWSLPNRSSVCVRRQYCNERRGTSLGGRIPWTRHIRPKMPRALAETVPNAEGVILVPAMVGLGAPYWDSAARGLVSNLERSHKAAHLARASLDAIAMQVADVLDAMEEEAGVRNYPLCWPTAEPRRNRRVDANAGRHLGA
jgi:glycerol kinase